MDISKYKDLIQLIKDDFQISWKGPHGLSHWLRVYKNTQILGKHYNIESEVFILFALLHDSKRENEFEDEFHGLRASIFVKELINKKIINLNTLDEKRLLYAFANHTHSNEDDELFNDKVVEICLDADRLDIGRVGYEVLPYYLKTEYAKSLC